MTRLSEDNPLVKAALVDTSATLSKKGGNRGNHPSFSVLLNRGFDSRGEMCYGEGLHFRELAHEISDLRFQHRIVLSRKPTVSITIDYVYMEHGHKVYADYKARDRKTGKIRMEEPFRIKLAWLREKYGIEVKIVTTE